MTFWCFYSLTKRREAFIQHWFKSTFGRLTSQVSAICQFNGFYVEARYVASLVSTTEPWINTVLYDKNPSSQLERTVSLQSEPKNSWRGFKFRLLSLRSQVWLCETFTDIYWVKLKKLWCESDRGCFQGGTLLCWSKWVFIYATDKPACKLLSRMCSKPSSCWNPTYLGWVRGGHLD